jgi:hypothetical protein
MVPTWLFGSGQRTKAVSPVDNDNMFPPWLKNRKLENGTMTKAVTAETETETGTAEDTIETKDGRHAEFTLYYYPHSFYSQKVPNLRKYWNFKAYK